MAPVWYSLSALPCLLVDEGGTWAWPSQMPGSKTIVNKTLVTRDLTGKGKVLVRNIRRFTSHFVGSSLRSWRSLWSLRLIALKAFYRKGRKEPQRRAKRFCT